ncbi:hypothetical protein B0H13DRAFT_2354565 [Mycena leptocephala]|nr:hypothetical protein B0H13DRAFT_2354565 [Mycena leptocephala]
MSPAKGRHSTASVYWWTTGIFTWEDFWFTYHVEVIHVELLYKLRQEKMDFSSFSLGLLWLLSAFITNFPVCMAPIVMDAPRPYPPVTRQDDSGLSMHDPTPEQLRRARLQVAEAESHGDILTWSPVTNSPEPERTDHQVDQQLRYALEPGPLCPPKPPR